MTSVTPQIEGRDIANFVIELGRRVNVLDPRGDEVLTYIEVTLIFEAEDRSETKKINLPDLECITWSELDYRASINPQVTMAKANRYIASDIRSALGDLPVINIYRLERPGLYKINGEAVFCTGDDVILPSSGFVQKEELECRPMTEQLDIDPNMSEEQAAAEMLNLISLFPDPGRVILSQMLVALLRQAYEDAGKAPSFCVFLYGSTGTQKTTIASFLTQIYSRRNGIAEPTRLNASCASAVEMLVGLADQVKVFDDLFPADSTQVRKSQEETLSEITRYIGDGTVPARMKGGKIREGRPKCGVLFTGEYLVGTGSSAARLLPVEMSKPDTTALKCFQDQPLIVSTFYHNFISWSLDSYNDIVACLTEWLEEYHKTDLGVHDRLRETHFFLNTAYTLLLQYCGEKGVLDEEDVLRFHANYVDLLTRLVREQNERVYPETVDLHSHGNPLDRIRELYKGGQLSVAADKRKFDENQHDGIIHKNCLCLRPQALSRFFPSSDVNEIARELAALDALVHGRDGLMKKISAIRGKYCYCIPLDRLQ